MVWGGLGQVEFLWMYCVFIDCLYYVFWIGIGVGDQVECFVFGWVNGLFYLVV